MSIKNLYIITGFLGAGKTTLMKQLVKNFANEKVAIVVNEFGKRSVDGVLLRNDNIEIKEITNGSIFCTCRSDLFIEALIKISEKDVNTILVETSGLSDPTNMDKILDLIQRISNDSFLMKGIIGVVDATNFLKIINTANPIKQQIAASQLIIINKKDLVSSNVIDNIKKTIRDINSTAIIRGTSYCHISNNQVLTDLNYSKFNMSGIIHKKMIGNQKILVRFHRSYSLVDFRKWIDCFINSIYRIKGFVNLLDEWYRIDGTHNSYILEPISVCEKKSFIVVLAAGNKPIKDRMISNWNKIFEEEINIE